MGAILVPFRSHLGDVLEILEAFGEHFGDIVRSWGALGRHMAPRSNKYDFQGPEPAKGLTPNLLKIVIFLFCFVLL